MIYTYTCEHCGEYELSQSIHDDALTECPTCHGVTERIVTGGYASFVKGRTLGSRAELNTDKMGQYEKDKLNKPTLDAKANAPWWRPNTTGPNMKLLKKTPEQLQRYVETGK